jgi:hypothetical protein
MEQRAMMSSMERTVLIEYIQSSSQLAPRQKRVYIQWVDMASDQLLLPLGPLEHIRTFRLF